MKSGRAQATCRARLRRWAQDESGAGLIEFAIILPVLVMLLLGIITGGNAYQEKLSLTNGAREGARYGATLPVDNFTSINLWLDDLSVVAAGAVDDGLGSGVDGRVVCVAYVYPNGSATNDRTTRRRVTGTGTAAYSNSTCFTDGRPVAERRIQVMLARSSEIDAALFTVPLTLTGKSVARFEATAG